MQSQNKKKNTESMYAIVNIAGQQFKVEKGKKIYVHRLAGEIGDSVHFEKVLLLSHEGNVKVGSPYVSDAGVQAQIVSHVRGDKVLVFKKKRRKGYQKLNGHRQNFTEILVEDILESAAPPKAEKKKVQKTIAPESTVLQEATATPPVTESPAESEVTAPEVPVGEVPAKKTPSRAKAAKPEAGAVEEAAPAKKKAAPKKNDAQTE